MGEKSTDGRLEIPYIEGNMIITGIKVGTWSYRKDGGPGI